MLSIKTRFDYNESQYPFRANNVVTRREVAQKYKELRDVRNENFPDKRKWPEWGTDTPLDS